MGKALGLFFGILIGGKLSPLGFIICLYICYKIGKSFDENLLERKKQNQKKYEPFHEFTQQFYQNHFAPQIPVIPFLEFWVISQNLMALLEKAKLHWPRVSYSGLIFMGFQKLKPFIHFEMVKIPTSTSNKPLTKSIKAPSITSAPANYYLNGCLKWQNLDLTGNARKHC